MRAVNVLAVELEESLSVGRFRHVQAPLRAQLGAHRIGATVYEAVAAHPIWPYHYHHGIEEWLFLPGAPDLLSACLSELPVYRHVP